jgi:hypothetical protein
MTLAAAELLRRFFLHVLPKGSSASATLARAPRHLASQVDAGKNEVHIISLKMAKK